MIITFNLIVVIAVLLVFVVVVVVVGTWTFIIQKIVYSSVISTTITTLAMCVIYQLIWKAVSLWFLRITDWYIQAHYQRSTNLKHKYFISQFAKPGLFQLELLTSWLHSAQIQTKTRGGDCKASFKNVSAILQLVTELVLHCIRSSQTNTKTEFKDTYMQSMPDPGVLEFCKVLC